MVAVRNDRVEPYEAAADLSTYQWHIVKRTGQGTNGGLVNVSGAGEQSMGVLQNKPKSGEAASVCESGSSRVVSDGTTPITAGDKLKAGALGVAVKSTGDKDHVLGIAMDNSAASGIIIGIDLTIYDAGV